MFQALSSIFVQPPVLASASVAPIGSVVVMTEAWYVPGESQFRISQYIEGNQDVRTDGEQFPREIHHQPIDVTAPRCVFDIEGIAKDRHKELLAELREEIKAHSLIIDERSLLEQRGR